MNSDPLKNGDGLPKHLPVSNVLPVNKYGTVRDATTGRRCQIAPHETLVAMMRENHAELRKASPELHFYQIEGEKIFHTRDEVVIEVE